MKIIEDKRLKIITAIIMVVLAVGVVAVCFLPSKVVLISGGKTYEPIYSGNRMGNKVSLTVNVYEGADVVLEMLDVLDEYNAKCTFFVGGCFIDDNTDLIVKILEKGHEIGSHGYFHKDHSKLSADENLAEMQLLHSLVKKVAGYEIKLFAPPSGAYSVETLKIAEKMGYKTILWSKDTIDWRDKSLKVLYNRATKNISAGDFVLMHPKKHTLQVLPQILEFYKSKGLLAVTVSECME